MFSKHQLPLPFLLLLICLHDTECPFRFFFKKSRTKLQAEGQVPATPVQEAYIHSFLIGLYSAPIPKVLSTVQADGISLFQEHLREGKSKSPADPEELHLSKMTDWALDVHVQQRQE